MEHATKGYQIEDFFELAERDLVLCDSARFDDGGLEAVEVDLAVKIEVLRQEHLGQDLSLSLDDIVELVHGRTAEPGLLASLLKQLPELGSENASINREKIRDLLAFVICSATVDLQDLPQGLRRNPIVLHLFGDLPADFVVRTGSQALDQHVDGICALEVQQRNAFPRSGVREC